MKFGLGQMVTCVAIALSGTIGARKDSLTAESTYFVETPTATVPGAWFKESELKAADDAAPMTAAPPPSDYVDRVFRNVETDKLYRVVGLAWNALTSGWAFALKEFGNFEHAIVHDVDSFFGVHKEVEDDNAVGVADDFVEPTAPAPVVAVVDNPAAPPAAVATIESDDPGRPVPHHGSGPAEIPPAPSAPSAGGEGDASASGVDPQS